MKKLIFWLLALASPCMAEYHKYEECKDSWIYSSYFRELRELESYKNYVNGVRGMAEILYPDNYELRHKFIDNKIFNLEEKRFNNDFNE